MTERSDTIGRFLVRGELGRGGAGRVVLARDPELDRDVAIKLLLPGDPVDWVQRVEAFRREGRIGSTLDHPAIAPIHEFGRTDEGDPFLVMRRVDGVSLREALGARGDSGARFSQARLLAAFAVACQAVGFAHRRGVVHRDLKPENVMLGQHGEVYVVDWGLAGGATRRAGPAQDPAATQDGTVIGTLGYLAPEAAFGVVSEVGPHSDVFSLGAILYEVLSGRRAICGDDLWRASLDPRIVPLPEVVPDLDEELAAVCAKALAREPRDRWSDAQELADALAAWQDGANRRTRADARVAEGRAALAAWTAGRGALQAADQRIRELEAAAAPWLPFDHPDKVAARDAISARTEAQVELAGRFAAVEAAGEGALVLDPAHAGARALLADACLQRLLEAERAGSAADAAYLRTRLVAWDDGTRSARLRAGGAVSLVTDPPGARVTARRYDQRPTVWALGDPVDLGHTPLDRVALAAGSWVLELESPGRRTTRYPVRIERDGHWDVHAERPLPLFTEAEIGEGWIYVPEGPYLSGGDPDVSFPRPLTEVWVDGFFVRRFAVTAAEYAGWLHQLKKAGEDWEARAPRI
ncbi:MAG: serine/threonine-protein kinase, partial [Myxococcota bacterium]